MKKIIAVVLTAVISISSVISLSGCTQTAVKASGECNVRALVVGGDTDAVCDMLTNGIMANIDVEVCDSETDLHDFDIAYIEEITEDIEIDDIKAFV